MQVCNVTVLNVTLPNKSKDVWWVCLARSWLGTSLRSWFVLRYVVCLDQIRADVQVAIHAYHFATVKSATCPSVYLTVINFAYTELV